MCAQAVEHDGRIFGPLRCCPMARKASTISSSANIMPGLESSDGGAQSYKIRRSLSVFGGNFVLAKIRLGLISVRYSELRGVRFSEVRNVW